MSQSGASISPNFASTVETAQKCTRIVPGESLVATALTYMASTSDLHNEPQPQQKPTLLSQHHTTLQVHDDSISRTVQVDNDAISVLHESRRGSFVWSLQPTYGDEATKINRNPVMPQRADSTTPPTMEELVRRMTGDTFSTRNSSPAHSDAVFSRPSTRRSSIAGTEIDSLTRTDTGTSISGLARSVTSKMPTIRSNRLSTEKASQGVSIQNTDGPESLSSAQSGKKSRRLSLQLPSSLKRETPPEMPLTSSLFVGEPQVHNIPNNILPGPPLQPNGGLAARRHVKMDLTIPVGLADLSKAHKRHGGHASLLSSITPSRPRSPKTPWIREKEVTWSSDAEFIPPSITDDVSIPIDLVRMITRSDADIGIKPAMSPAATQTADVDIATEPVLPRKPSPLSNTAFERPPQRVRDRFHISQPPNKSDTSGWLAGESDSGNTAEIRSTPEAGNGMTKKDTDIQKELLQLAKSSKAARSRRWPWNRSRASDSEEQAKTKDERHEEPKSSPVNIFRRSHRFPETKDNQKKEKKSSSHMGSPWRREKPVDKPPLPSASLANMFVPPAFVPPGSEKVHTPPNFNTAHEVRGKLADFFFDINGFSSARRKSKPSPDGYWDSNAVLMSMRPDLALAKDKDEEGPDGHPPPAAFHFGPVNDTPARDPTPGLYTAPDGYLRAKGFSTSPSQRSLITPTQGAQDSWFRMHYGDHTADEELLTAAALKEADERRKFEWLVPEHLPNSPLCPLHPKYVGPSKGLCYWHGRKANGWGVEPSRDYISDPMKIGQGKTRGWEVGKVEAPKEQKRKRRLQDFVDPA